MTKVVLIRHGRSTANADGVLAGRMAGVALDEVGREQARALGTLLDGVRVAAAYTSPVQRCRETATLAGFPDAAPLNGMTECDYGHWTGSPLAELREHSLWPEIQASPSTVRFPGGESMMEMFERCTAEVDGVARRHEADDVVLVFSHGDPIKAVLMHACGIPVDEFQRLHVAPAGVSVVQYGGPRPLVLCINAGGDLASLIAATTAPPVGGGDVAPAQPSRG